jgi:hypothetical protein
MESSLHGLPWLKLARRMRSWLVASSITHWFKPSSPWFWLCQPDKVPGWLAPLSTPAGQGGASWPLCSWPTITGKSMSPLTKSTTVSVPIGGMKTAP